MSRLPKSKHIILAYKSQHSPPALSHCLLRSIISSINCFLNSLSVLLTLNMGLPTLYHSIVIPLLFTLFGSLTRAHYDRLCPPQDPQVQVDLTFYTVACGTSLLSGFRYERMHHPRTALDCARQIQNAMPQSGIQANAGSQRMRTLHHLVSQMRSY
jgi:hypothetical protein